MIFLIKDLRHALRQLAAHPRFAILVILTVALGIGANTGIFSMVNGYSRPLPVRDADRIVVLAAQEKGDDTGLRYQLSYPALRDFRAPASPFSEVFAFDLGVGGFSAGTRTVQFVYSIVTGNHFSALGVQPAVGRLFLPGEGEAPGSDFLIVLGHRFWLKQFGGDPAVVGRQVRVNGIAARVIGVAPKEFRGLYAGLDMDGYVPMSSLAPLWELDSTQLFSSRARRAWTVFGRMKPGLSLSQAQGAADVIARRIEAEYPATDKGIGIRLVPETLARPMPLRFLAEQGPVVRGFVLLLAAVVLLLACMNVANVLLVRATARDREMAIRAALGSGRARLIRQALTESLLLAVLGAAAGLLLGQWSSSAFAAWLDLATDFPVLLDFSFDWRVFAYALAAAVATGVFIGIWPALQASRARPGTALGAALHDGARGSGGPGRQRARSLLVVGQVAGSLILLIVAGLFVRSLRNVERLDLGFDSSHVLNVRLDPQWAGYDQRRARDYYRELKRRVRALPGVESASLAFSVPMGYYNNTEDVFLEGRPREAGEQPPAVACNFVDEDYFDTMRIPILRGRAFTEADSEKAPRVAIVNQSMAARFWPHQDPIGKRFRFGAAGSPLWQVVGVAHDGKYLVVFENPLPYFYVPSEQAFNSMRILQVRTSVAPQSLSVPLQREIEALDPSVPMQDLQTMGQSLAGGFGFLIFRLGAMQASALGVLGLLLAAIGVYGVVSYGAAQRTREIGIRVALGAEPRDVLGLILRQGVWLVAGGVLLGLLGAAALTRVIARFLVLARAADPLVFAGVTLLLAAIALAACYLPARRAARLDPTIALRHE